jgi:hypothetical protein
VPGLFILRNGHAVKQNKFSVRRAEGERQQFPALRCGCLPCRDGTRVFPSDAFFGANGQCDGVFDHRFHRADLLGRMTSDTITTLGSGVDGSVRRIDTAYDGQGNPYLCWFGVVLVQLMLT